MLATQDTGDGQPAKKRGRGKAPGAQPFSELDKKRAFVVMKQIVPIGSSDWTSVATHYSKVGKQHGRKERDGEFLKKFHIHLLHKGSNKPMDAPGLPWDIAEAREVKEMIDARIAMISVEDPPNGEEDGDRLDNVEDDDVEMLGEDDWSESRSSHNNNAPGGNATTYNRTMEKSISRIASGANGTYDLDLENSKLR